MAMWIFTEAIRAGRPIRLFNHGRMLRDFTFVEDVVEAIVRVVYKPAKPDAGWSGNSPDPASSRAPWRIYNIGNHHPVELTEVVRLIEEALGRKAICELAPMQPGDVSATYADVDALTRAVDFEPTTPIAIGVRRFVEWFIAYHTG
jgi:UDP-glucuronate 4-epimerase